MSSAGQDLDPLTVQRRACLRCREDFLSEGAHHRICDHCKQSQDWKSGGSFDDAEGFKLGLGHRRARR